MNEDQLEREARRLAEADQGGAIDADLAHLQSLLDDAGAAERAAAEASDDLDSAVARGLREAQAEAAPPSGRRARTVFGRGALFGAALAAAAVLIVALVLQDKEAPHPPDGGTTPDDELVFLGGEGEVQGIRVERGSDGRLERVLFDVPDTVLQFSVTISAFAGDRTRSGLAGLTPKVESEIFETEWSVPPELADLEEGLTLRFELFDPITKAPLGDDALFYVSRR